MKRWDGVWKLHLWKTAVLFSSPEVKGVHTQLARERRKEYLWPQIGSGMDLVKKEKRL